MTADTERLAWRPANDNVRLWKLGFRRQDDLFAIPFEISPVSFTSISVLFVAERVKSLRLESECQSTTARKQIQHPDFPFWFWTKQRIDSVDVIHFSILFFIENMAGRDFVIAAAFGLISLPCAKFAREICERQSVFAGG